MKFEIHGEELVIYNKWLHEHNKVCPFKNGENQGAIGGRLTFSFTPTGLGSAKSVKCACGAECNCTDYGSW